MMYPTFILFAISLWLTGAAHSSAMLLIAGALVGLSYGSFSPFSQTIAIRHASPERIGIATSTFFGLFDMGVGMGPFVLGFVIPYTGYRNLYYLAALFVLVVIGIYYFVHGRHGAKF